MPRRKSKELSQQKKIEDLTSSRPYYPPWLEGIRVWAVLDDPESNTYHLNVEIIETGRIFERIVDFDIVDSEVIFYDSYCCDPDHKALGELEEYFDHEFCFFSLLEEDLNMDGSFLLF